MKERRKFIKTMAVSAGAISLPTAAQAQSTTALTAVYSLLLGSQIVTPGAASGTGYITSGAIVSAAASAMVTIAIPADI